MKERLTSRLAKSGQRRVSIHAPVKERHTIGHGAERRLGFNSRPCEGATSLNIKINKYKNVSIHAPVKERRE